jgi:hypothetical protein
VSDPYAPPAIITSGGVRVVEDTVSIRDSIGRSVSFLIGSDSCTVQATPALTMVVPRADLARLTLGLVAVLMDVEAR